MTAEAIRSYPTFSRALRNRATRSSSRCGNQDSRQSHQPWHRAALHRAAGNRHGRPRRQCQQRGAGTKGAPLFQYAQSEFLFKGINDIPPLLVKTLLFLENRDLDHPAASWQNPVIEWDRMVKALFYYIGAKFYLPVPVQGGSTLAVQLEKFRHSPHGRTDTPLEKLRQLVGASLKAYRAGKNTRAWRERIIVDYFNAVPLAAAPGYGEIHGLGEGLYAWFGTELEDALKAIKEPGITAAKVDAYKQVLTLLVSVRSPSAFLVDDRPGLEEKVRQFAKLMAREGIIEKAAGGRH